MLTFNYEVGIDEKGFREEPFFFAVGLLNEFIFGNYFPVWEGDRNTKIFILLKFSI